MDEGKEKSAGDGLAWELLKTEHLVRDEWIDFRREEFRMPDGTTFSPFYNYSKRDYAVILAADEEGKLLCVKQYRHGIRQVTTEFVAGGLEYKKELVYEDALDAAKRELLEETGYQSGEWEKLITIPSHATLSDDYVHVFIARNCCKVSGQALDDTEFLNVIRLSAEELEALIAKGEFQQAVHVMAWYMAKAQGKI